MEVGFPMGRRFPFEYYLKLWDMLSLKGIFLTGYGANDCHANNDGWIEGNNFVAYIGVDPDLEYPIDVKHFINAMKKGRVYTGDPTKIKGEISFETENGEQMGSVIKVKDNEEIKMKFNADNVTPGWKFRLVENGETVETCQITENIFEYESKLNLKGGILSFRRAEIWDETGKCILLTNPIYVVNNLFISEHSDDVRVTQRLCVPHKIYVTHHGQVDDSLISDFESIPLTDLGTEQSKKTGEYLKYKGFCGKIYYTPYSCTKETAEIIASYTGSEVILFDGTQNLKEELEKLSLMEDLLFVTTSEIHENIGKLFGMKMNERACNCSLSTVNTNGKAVYADPSHMPYKMRGFNTKMCSDIDFKTIQDYMKDDESIFDEIAKEKGTKLLHISDTTSFSYPYIKRLVNKVKPDIIIHTGDFVDEVKAGRMINTFDEYESGVKEICNILTSSSAKEIYAVCGNNDIFDVLKKHLPNAKVSMPGSVEKICGIDCLLAHGPTQVTDETQWAFYGHGLTGECWSPDKNNVKSGRCRFNAIWNLSVITLPERKQYVIKHPVYRK